MSVTNTITERTVTGVNESEDLFLDNSSSTVSNTGAVERDIEASHDANFVHPLGDEMILNGSFDTDSDWVKGTGTTISGGNANFVNATGVSLYQNIGTQSGTVKVEFTVTNYTSGTLNVYSGGNQSVGVVNVSANALGTYTFYVDRNGGNVNIIFGSSDNFTGSIDNVSVKEVLVNRESTVNNTGVTIRDIEGVNESEVMFPDNTSSDILNTGESVLPLLRSLEDRAEYYENEEDTIELLSSYRADLLSKASIIMTPTAYSDGELHSVKPVGENGVFDFTRGSSATRVNEQGLIQDVQILSGELVQNGNFEQIGSELVTNGDFSDNSWWGLDPVWSISNGSANCNGSGVIYKGGVLTVGKTYKVQVEISSYTSGTLTYPNASYTLPSAVGSYTFYYKANSQTISFTGSSFIGSIDNVSVKEVGQNWSFGTGWSMGDGKAVKTSGTGSSLFQTVPTTTIGKKYKFTFDAIVTGGVANATLYGVTIPIFSTSGSQEHTIIATSTTGFIFFGNNSFEGSIDNISVIEVTDDTNLPRIDYTDGTGSLLLEPQSTNLFLYSQDFTNSYWLHNADITVTNSSELAPNGQLDANLIEYDGSGYSFIRAQFGATYTTSTLSVFAKKGNWRYLGFRNFQTAGHGHTVFDFDTETFSNIASGQSASFEVFSNGWYRIKVNQPSPEANNFAGFALTNSTGAESSPTGGQVANVHLFGAQVEESYATSYIPTNGSTVTRLADVCNNAGSSDLINSTEGVLYAEIAALADDQTNRRITISDGTNTNRVVMGYNTNTNQIFYFVVVGNSTVASGNYTSSDITQFSKVAIKFKANDFALWVDGIERHTDTSGIIFSENALTSLQFEQGSGNSLLFYGNVKSVAVFKEADIDLEKLTTI